MTYIIKKTKWPGLTIQEVDCSILQDTDIFDKEGEKVVIKMTDALDCCMSCSQEHCFMLYFLRKGNWRVVRHEEKRHSSD